MSKLVRFGVSMDAELLSAFDRIIERKGYENRSEALRDLVRQAIVESKLASAEEAAVAALCLVYDHRAGEVEAKLTRLQHAHADRIISSLHVHLDAQRCLEVVVLRGPAGELQAVSHKMMAAHGVRDGQVVMTAAGDLVK
jgi:CopG family nickel-responsive transcriptional regulator